MNNPGLKRGKINADLSIGADLSGVVAMKANQGVASPGMKVNGTGFVVPKTKAESLIEENKRNAACLRPYVNGSDITGKSRNGYIVDFTGLTLDEAAELYPDLYAIIEEKVKPQRDKSRTAKLRDNWHLFESSRPDLRKALEGLDRYIATSETAKHRNFVFVDGSIVPDNAVIAIALDDAYYIGVLSSRIHRAWTTAIGGRLEERERYNKAVCFDQFPFPKATDTQKQRIREIAERLDKARRDALAKSKKLTLTGLYNDLPDDIAEIHRELDAAVFEVYELDPDIDDDAIIRYLVELNRERAKEERQGTIRYLRPDF